MLRSTTGTSNDAVQNNQGIDNKIEDSHRQTGAQLPRKSQDSNHDAAMENNNSILLTDDMILDLTASSNRISFVIPPSNGATEELPEGQFGIGEADINLEGHPHEETTLEEERFNESKTTKRSKENRSLAFRLRSSLANAQSSFRSISGSITSASDAVVLSDDTILDLTRCSLTSINHDGLVDTKTIDELQKECNEGYGEMEDTSSSANNETDRLDAKYLQDHMTLASRLRVALSSSRRSRNDSLDNSKGTDGAIATADNAAMHLKRATPAPQKDEKPIDAALVMETNGLRTVKALSPDEVKLIMSIRSCHKTTQSGGRARTKESVLRQTQDLLYSDETSETEGAVDEFKYHALYDSLASVVEGNMEEIKKQEKSLAEVDENVMKASGISGSLRRSNLRSSSTRGSCRTSGRQQVQQHEQQRQHRHAVQPGAHAIRGRDYAGVQGASDSISFDIETQQTGVAGRGSNANDETQLVASMVEHTTEAAVLSPEEMEELAKPGLRRRRYLLLSAVACALIAIIIGISVSLTTRSEEATTTLAPSSSPTTLPTLTFESRVQFLQYIINKTVLADSNTTALLLPNTPQHRAFEWLSQEEPMLMDQIRILQRYVLALLYFSTSGESWSRINFFFDSGNECDWMTTGITCLDSGVISELDLSNNQMKGSLPHEIFALTNLVRLNLHGNRLEGQLPSMGLRQLTLLKEFDVSSNRLVGTIPCEVESLSSVEILTMASNNIGGPLPTGITKLTGLQGINFGDNSLTGTIPFELYNMTQLVSLSLRSNSLTGTLATEVGQLTLLSDLDLPACLMTGTIPSEIGKLTDLTRIQINNMKLSGSIPTALEHLTKLTKLALANNPITGTLPESFSNFTKLRELYLQDMQIVGNISFLCDKIQPRLRVFRVDIEEVICDCCKCCY